MPPSRRSGGRRSPPCVSRSGRWRRWQPTCCCRPWPARAARPGRCRCRDASSTTSWWCGSPRRRPRAAEGARPGGCTEKEGCRQRCQYGLTCAKKADGRARPPRAAGGGLMQNATGNPEDILAATLLQLIVIVLVARGASVWLRRIGQPGAVGEILAGLLLGPSFLGAVFPEWSGFVFGAATAAPIHLISQIGLIFLMFQIGSDFNFAHLERTEYRRAVAAVAAASLLAPLALGLLVGRWSAPAL